MNETILCIDNSPGEVGSHGLYPHEWSEAMPFLSSRMSWQPRTPELEQDRRFLQVIPYVVLTLRQMPKPEGPLLAVLVGKRLGGGNEARLHDAYTLGFGGHVKRPSGTDDFQSAVLCSICDELEEELDLRLSDIKTEPKFVGLLSDLTNDVGRVHLGLVWEVALPVWLAQAVRMAEPDKLDVFWTTPKSLHMLETGFEGWARIVYTEYLRQ